MGRLSAGHDALAQRKNLMRGRKKVTAGILLMSLNNYSDCPIWITTTLRF